MKIMGVSKILFAMFLASTIGVLAADLPGKSAKPEKKIVADAAGLKIYVQSPLRSEFETDPSKKVELGTIEIVGARNGFFSGKVVVASNSNIGKIKGEAEDLKQVNGTGKIPSTAIEIRYGLVNENPNQNTSFDSLSIDPPDSLPVLSKSAFAGHRFWMSSEPSMDFALASVWVIVNVPADALPGEYEGLLKVKVGGSTAKVPIKLTVAAWKLPDPKDYQTFVELVQSPDTLSLYYNVPLWSKKHWEYIEKSFEQIAKVGSKTLYIPLICETNLGNEESMIRWIKDGTKYKYDLKIAEQYIDTAIKAGIVPKFIMFWVWDAYLEGGEVATGYLDPSWYASKEEDLGPKVTLVNPATNKTEGINLPKYSDAAKSLPLWKPLAAEIKTMLKKKGLEKTMVWGMCSDKVPNAEFVKFFKSVDPDVLWSRRGHNRFNNIHGVNYALQISPSGSAFSYDLKDGEISYGWQTGGPTVQAGFNRGMRDYFARCRFRMTNEVNIGGKQAGSGGFGGDTWPSIKDKRGNIRVTDGRYMKSVWRNVSVTTNLLAPSKNGAIPTARYIVFREGVQECEARIFIEKAIVANKISGTLSKKCKELILERNKGVKQEIPKNWHYGETHYETVKKEYPEFVDGPWQERSKKLFDAAAEVAKAMGIK